MKYLLWLFNLYFKNHKIIGTYYKSENLFILDDFVLLKKYDLHILNKTHSVLINEKNK